MENTPFLDTYTTIVTHNKTDIQIMQFSTQGAICAINGVAFLTNAVAAFYFSDYVAYMEEHEFTPLRWVDYVITMPSTMVLIATLCGIRDRFALSGMAGLMFAAMMCGPLAQYTRKYGHRIISQYQNTETTYTVYVTAAVFMTWSFSNIWVAYSTHDTASNHLTGIVVTTSILSYCIGFVPLLAIALDQTCIFEERLQNIIGIALRLPLTLLLLYIYI
jgi:hypothetical protein